jgi:putative tricarboxylic transport membrane protein
MQQEENAERVLVSKRWADIVVALILAGVGGMVMLDSWRRGIHWVEDASDFQSGYFPFYVGLAIVLTSLGTAAIALLRRSGAGEAFVKRAQFRDVLKVLIPTAIFVAAIGFIGIYVAMALFIAAFMRWLGRFKWRLVVPVSIGVPVVLFLVFEIWFLVSLPKGPLEDWLGY